MNCNYCNAENPEEAVFCKECGKRLDGKTVCKECGALVPADAVYCIACGKRIDGKSVCTQCGTAFEGSFCPACGTPAVQSKKKTLSPSAQNRATADESAETPVWKKIVEICASSLGLGAVLCSLLFVFFIGFGVGGSPNFEKALQDMGIAVQTNDMYYFFGKGYEKIASELDGLQTYTPLYEVSLYLPVVLGTVITAGVLVAVPVLSVLAAVKLVQKLTGKDAKGAEKLVFAAYFTYVAGAVALLVLEHVSVSATQAIVSGSSLVVSARGELTFNAATVAGLTLGGVFISLFAMCKVAVKGKSLISPPVLMKTCFSLGCIILLAVAWTFAGQSAGGFTQTESNDSMSLAVAFPAIMQLIGSNNLASDSPEAVTAFVLDCCAFVIQIALIALIAAAAVKICTDLAEEKHIPTLGLSISVSAVAAVYLVFAVLAGTMSADQLFGSSVTGITLYFTPVITAFVFAVLQLVVTIVRTALKKKMIDSAE